MLELIRHWLVGITCAAMLVALAESLIPAGSIRRIARLTGGLVLLAAILNPLLKLDTTALTRALTEYKLELSAYSADLEEENEILMKDIIEEQSGAYIQDKAAALGIDCQVTVEADGEEEWPIPQSVTVMGSLTAEQQEALERTIEEDFAIPAERRFCCCLPSAGRSAAAGRLKAVRNPVPTLSRWRSWSGSWNRPWPRSTALGRCGWC